MASRIHSIHHINFPTTDKDRARAWYSKVFGLEQEDVSHLSSTPVLLMTAGRCDLHFTPVKEIQRKTPYHFAIEVDDWASFLAHLDELGIEYEKPLIRPQNNSKTTRFQDPDGTFVEVTYHGDWH